MKWVTLLLIAILLGCGTETVDITTHPLDGTYISSSRENGEDPEKVAIEYTDLQTIRVTYDGQVAAYVELDILTDGTYSLFWQTGCQLFTFRQNRPDQWDDFTLTHSNCGRIERSSYKRLTFNATTAHNASSTLISD